MNRSILKPSVKSTTRFFHFSGPKPHLGARYFFTFALLVLLTSCIEPDSSSVPRTLPCPSIADSPWAKFRFGVDSPSEVASTAVDLWGIERDQIGELSSAVDPGPILWWRTEVLGGTEDNYYASFHKGQHLKKIKVEWTWPDPTFAQIIDCLGSPDQYIAFYDLTPEVTTLNLALFYSDIGVVVRHNGAIWGDELPKIHPNLRMARFVLVTPGTAEQIANRHVQLR